MTAPGGSVPLLACELAGHDDAAAARRQLAFLMEASDALSSSVDIRPTLARVAALVVPRLADWCSIHLVGSDGSLRRVSVLHADPELTEMAEELMTRQRANVEGDHPVGEAIRTGRPQLVAVVPRDFILRNANDQRDVELYDAVGSSSSIAAPLVARDKVVGVIGLNLGPSGRVYEQSDLVLVELLARRCAMAVDNARLFEQAQEAFRRTDESAALLDTLFQTAPVGLGFVDASLRYVRVNDHYAATSGLAAEDHPGRRVTDVIPDIAHLVEPLYEKVLATGDAILDVTIRGETAADPGVTHDWLASYFPVSDSDGATVGVGVIKQDMTNERLAREELRQRARQQAAVAELGERALRTQDRDELMNDAVNVVADTLSIDSAAISELIRTKGVLRLRAVVGWPRTWLGTDAPPSNDTQAGYTLQLNRPVVVTDVANEDRFGTAPQVIDAGIVGMLSVPIRGQEAGAVGVLSGSIRSSREWSEYDVDFLEAIANVVGAAWARADAENELREERERLGLALEAGRMGTWHWDLLSGKVHWSETLETIFGLAPGSFDGKYDSYLAMLHPEDRPVMQASIQSALDRGTPHHIIHRFIGPGDEMRWMEGIGRVIRDEEGSPVAMIGVATDITERRDADAERAQLLEAEQAARAAAEEARERLSFLAEASGVLAESLDYRSTLARVARLAVPRLGEWCSVEVPDDDYGDVPFVVAHIDPAKVELVHELRRCYPADPMETTGVYHVMRTGEPERYNEISDDEVAAKAVDDEHLAMLRQLQMRAVMVVPLLARGRTLGAITFVSSEPDRRYSSGDLALAEELARRAGLAIDNARLFRERSHVARTLQQTLLPPRLPTIPGVQIAARYRFAAEGTEIGGDFYDLFETADGAWAIVIGDACGKGPEAAALTGLARHSLRAAAVREPSPARVLWLLNEAILDQVADNRFLTMAYARLEPGEGQARLVVACGGHPPPIVVRASGEVTPLSLPGMIIGSLPDPEFTEGEVILAEGDAIVFYTDGVVEARRGAEIFGDQRLLELLQRCTDHDARGIANAVRQAVGDFLPGLPRDDMAILVLRVVPAGNS